LKTFGLAWLHPMGSGQKLCSVEILTGHETQANPVAEFCVLEAEVTDFLEHGTAIGVAVRVPTSGEGIHSAAKK